MDEILISSLQHGVRGFIYEHDQLDHIAKGVQCIFLGEMRVPRKILTHFVLRNFDEMEGYNQSLEIGLLTAREEEILRSIALGASNQEIAEKFFVSPNTVKTHIHNIYKKIDAENRLQAALWAAKYL